jgi:hypothetical protein
MTVLTVGTSDLPISVGNAKTGDTIIGKPGTLDKLITISASNVSLYLDGVILRPVLNPYVFKADIKNIVGMNALGFSGAFVDLTSSQKKAVATYLSTHTVDTTAATAFVNTFLATLSPIKDARMFDANPQRTGSITYNGLNYLIPVHWHSNVPKGIVTVKTDVRGTYIHGGTYQNARMEGSSYNAAGIRTQQGSDLWVEAAIFQDCEDGVLAGHAYIANPAGDWYHEQPPTRLDMYGFNVDKDCIYDNCGAIGKSHGFYGGNALVNLSVRPKSVRARGGHYRKFHGGLQVCIGGDFEDATDSIGVQQCIDMTSGPGLVINNRIVKATDGGNPGPPVLMRNGREPIPDWFENALIVKGNDITYSLNHVSAFVQALNEAQYSDNNGDGIRWPGVPKNIRTVVDGNIFRCPGGYPVAKTPVLAPPGSTIGNNPIIGLNDSAPDVKVPLPNYAFTRASKNEDLADMLFKAYPDSQAWAPKLLASPTYPAGTIINFPESEEDPAVIAELKAENATLTAELTATKDALATSEAQKQALADTVARAHAQAVDLSSSAQALVGALE